MNNTKLAELRVKIDDIDNEITRLFCQRMSIVADVAKYKSENNLPILDSSRENEKIYKVTKDLDDVMGEYTKMLFATIFDLSRSYQGQMIHKDGSLDKEIKNAIDVTPKLFPKSAAVACQGKEGANSAYACDKIFSRANKIYMNTFDSVFLAVENGLCKYGILPIENSLHGSVTEVYDLMKKYKFHISRSAKVKIDHLLLAKIKIDPSEIKEIYSHPQALAQCSEYIKTLKAAQIIECENTAIAADLVAKSDRTDIAAIANKDCSQIYNLKILSDDIQNNDNNHTRFICISKSMEIYPGSNKISLMFTIPHRPGALYSIISKFSAIGVNLSKIESRPIPGKDFEFMFYIDLDADINDPSVQKLLTQLQESADKFVFLGSYSEV